MRFHTIKALVTGGATGIGREIARRLIAEGAEAAICGRRRDRVEEAASALGCLGFVGDVGNEADAQRLVASAIAGLGGLNVLVNNAAFGRFAELSTQDCADFEAVLKTNVTGAMLMAREASRHFTAQRTGTIMNIGSTSGLRGGAGASAYVASKFALRGMTECWRAELRKHNVRVMLLNPSEVITGFAAAAGYTQTDNPTKLHAEDIAHAALAMLSMDDVGFTTEMTVWATNPQD
ncbi:MAG: SDR family oxidoreductase [Candidatus Hydrogenedentes bacterium]|nr:SDR family oxidoreductase [Candidatus Hydrogenedentota bacterium]